MDKVFADQGVVFEGEIRKHKARFELPSEEEEDDVNYDPYGQLGYGWEAYFSTMNIFGWIFLLMTICMLPAFSYYYHYGGLKSSSHGYYNSAWMLGNFGFNKQVCVSDYVQLNANRTLGCEVGTMSELIYAGIIPNNTDYENEDVMPAGYCGDPNYELNPDAPS